MPAVVNVREIVVLMLTPDDVVRIETAVLRIFLLPIVKVRALENYFTCAQWELSNCFTCAQSVASYDVAARMFPG